MKKRSFAVVPLLLTLLLAVWFGLSLHRVEESRRHEGLVQLENALRRGAVTHYSTTGAYPATLEELCATYGVQIDEDHYRVFYEVFAQNIMPEITVLEQ